MIGASTGTARGASPFTRPGPCPFQPLDEGARFVPHGAPAAGTTWERVVDDLLRIRTLLDDWDGEGSVAPPPALVDGAITLTQSLQQYGVTPPHRTHAGVNGTVVFEWYTPLGYLEIEVVSPVDAERRWVPKGADAADVTTYTLRR